MLSSEERVIDRRIIDIISYRLHPEFSSSTEPLELVIAPPSVSCGDQEGQKIDKNVANCRLQGSRLNGSNYASQAYLEDNRRLIIIRRLSAQDYENGYLELLQQLTTVGPVTREAFEKRVSEINSSTGQVVLVAEDTVTGRVVASASLVVEFKFIHGCANAGHIEDVVVDSQYRGLRLGRRIVEELLGESKRRGCYKTILNCTEEYVAFYEKCGFYKKERQMRYDHDDE